MMMIKLIMGFPTFVAKANTSMQNISRQGELTPRGSAALPVVQLFIVFLEAFLETGLEFLELST